MIDTWGREIDYLRISVTDRCNLRCIYCMPQDGIEIKAHEEILSFDEIVRVCSIMVDLGIEKVKLTGGEPLVRKNISTLVKEIKDIKGIESVTITTNGLLLEEKVEELYLAGIDGINISLDTLDNDLFEKITGRNKLNKVLNSINKVLEYPEINLKINCVPLGIPEQKLTDIVQLAKYNQIHVRFIEIMPIGLGKQFKYKSEDDIVNELSGIYGNMTRVNNTFGNGPCHYYSINGFKGKIGFISAISHKFCNSCNRIRLTSEGFLKTCLQYDIGTDLRKIIRNGGSDRQLRDSIEQAIINKPKEHKFLIGSINNEEQSNMSHIGG